MAEVRVLIVANDPLVRAGLAASLADLPECVVAGQLAADALLPEEVALYRPGVVLWDLGWDPAPDLEANLERLSRLADDGLPIVALLPERAHVAEVQAAGAQGLLFRDAELGLLLAALQAASQGLVVLEPGLATAVRPRVDPSAGHLMEELTSREMEVLQLLADGLTNRAIAQRLRISEHTVKFHVNAILGKLDAQSRTEAVVRATRLGLLLL